MKKRMIKLKNPDDTKRFLKCDIAQVTGNCRWRLRDRYRGRHNPPFDILQPGQYQPGWPIKSVQLLNDQHPEGIRPL